MFQFVTDSLVFLDELVQPQLMSFALGCCLAKLGMCLVVEEVESLLVEGHQADVSLERRQLIVVVVSVLSLGLF